MQKKETNGSLNNLNNGSSYDSNTHGTRLEGHEGVIPDWDQPGRVDTGQDGSISLVGISERTTGEGRCEWEPFPDFCRVVDGLPGRVDRLKGLGNAIVPQVAAEILRCMMRVDSLHNTAMMASEAKEAQS